MKNLAWTLFAAVVLAGLALPAGAQDKKTESAEKWPANNAEAGYDLQQPEKGPGGSDYKHEEVEVYEDLEAGEHYWLYTPAKPRPKKAPVVVLVHGYGQLDPEGYDAWIHHLVKRGNIVIYPQYQAHGLEPSANYAPNSATSITHALEYLEEDDERVQPVRKNFAIVGHSAGGVTAANLAADWKELEIPRPAAVMPVQPGRGFSYKNTAQKNGLIPLSDYSGIPEDCLLLSVYGDSDHTVGAWCARKVFADATSVKPENKNLVEFVSCDYNGASVVAGHRTPASPLTREEMIDNWDYLGYWKLFDGLTDAAFHGKNREYALGDTPEQKYMGKYSDGRPFEPLKVWLGDAEVDPDAVEYEPVFDRRGNRVIAKDKKDDAKERKSPEGKTPNRKDEEEGF